MDNSSPNCTYDVAVIGGGPVGLNAAYEVAKAGRSVVVLERRNFFNQAGSSGDLARMFRTMYTEDFMADLAFDSMKIWDELERDAGESLRLMTGLLNFGDPNYGAGGPEGTLLGPIDNLKRLKMPYRELTRKDIEAEYPFTKLPPDWIGLFAPDNGIINVPLLLRTLLNLARAYGARLYQNTSVTKIEPISKGPRKLWKVFYEAENCGGGAYLAEKLIITAGAYINHILTPSFNIHLNLNIWEMTATYFGLKPGPKGTLFPSMWFQFAEDEGDQSRLYYGFPSLPWGPPNMARISLDAATRQITDPSQRKTNVVDPTDVANVQGFVKEHLVGVDGTVPAYSLTCLQTNVFDNMFVLDFLPEQYLRGGAKDSVAIYTAGWGMKFVPLLGRALKDMALCGSSKFALSQFAITRKDPKGGGIIVDGPVKDLSENSTSKDGQTRVCGSSMRRMGH